MRPLGTGLNSQRFIAATFDRDLNHDNLGRGNSPLAEPGLSVRIVGDGSQLEVTTLYADLAEVEDDRRGARSDEVRRPDRTDAIGVRRSRAEHVQLEPRGHLRFHARSVADAA